MRVCLVSPPSITELRDPAVCPSHARRLASQSAPLGALTLAARLEQDRTQVEVVDLNHLLADFIARDDEPLDRFSHEVVSALESRRADVYGFTTMWSTYPLTLRVVADLKRRRADCLTILGGPQASLVDRATLQRFDAVDAVVRGEAEATLPLALAALGGGGSPDRVAGLSFRAKGRVVRNDGAPPISDLDSVPFPAYHLHDNIDGGSYLPLELGRGCPFGCTFCSTNDFFSRRYRLKSPEALLAQMRRLNDAYGVTRFDLVHDMFTANRHRVRDICDAFIASSENFEWYCSARTDCVDEELLELMAEAGCRGIFFGIETGSARLQDAAHKHLDLDEAAQRIGSSAGYTMQTTVSLIMGFPDETKDDLRATVAFLMDALRHDYVDPQVHLLTPLNDTPLERELRGRLVLDDVYGDLSHSGWAQAGEDRALIAAHPDMFVSFYSLPLSHLQRDYVQELRVFLRYAINRFRWLLVALHDEVGDVVGVFDEWRRWSGSDAISDPHERLARYTEAWFGTEFLGFVEERYSEPAERPKVAAMVEYAQALEHSIVDAGCPAEAVNGPRRAADVHVMRLPRRITCVIEALRTDSSQVADLTGTAVLATRPDGQRIDILELGPLLGDLLERCDGTRSVGKLALEIGAEDLVKDLDGDLVIRLGLDELRLSGLIG